MTKLEQQEVAREELNRRYEAACPAYWIDAYMLERSMTLEQWVLAELDAFSHKRTLPNTAPSTTAFS
jgi:hypothetical protein